MKRAALFALVIASSAALELESEATRRGRSRTSKACENREPGEEQDACFETRRQNQENAKINRAARLAAEEEERRAALTQEERDAEDAEIQAKMDAHEAEVQRVQHCTENVGLCVQDSWGLIA